MSYIHAEDVLPQELIDAIQAHVSGVSIYIPCKEKQVWGTRTKTRAYYEARNRQILEKYETGSTVKLLSREYALSEKSIQRILRNTKMKTHQFIPLREQPKMKEAAAAWFHSKWGVPEEAYLQCMEAYLRRETPLGWYLCLCGGRIVGGLGVIENDFHDRPDLTPNICAVYTEEAHRNQGIAGKLLHMAVEDLRTNGITPVYLVTDHTGFYERYGWTFLCMVQGDGEPEQTRMYIHP